jgi:hypothetical protein
VQNIPDEGDNVHGKRNDYILLAMERGSFAERYLMSRPPEHRSSWRISLSALQAYFASTERLEMVSGALEISLLAYDLAYGLVNLPYTGQTSCN